MTWIEMGPVLDRANRFHAAPFDPPSDPAFHSPPHRLVAAQIDGSTNGRATPTGAGDVVEFVDVETGFVVEVVVEVDAGLAAVDVVLCGLVDAEEPETSDVSMETSELVGDVEPPSNVQAEARTTNVANTTVNRTDPSCHRQLPPDSQDCRAYRCPIWVDMSVISERARRAALRRGCRSLGRIIERALQGIAVRWFAGIALDPEALGSCFDRHRCVSEGCVDFFSFGVNLIMVWDV